MSLNLAAFEQAFFEAETEGKAVAAVIVNSPNNPSGKIYNVQSVADLASIMRSYRKKTGKKPYLICDEPYRDIVYDGVQVPSVFPLYDERLVVSSFAKNFSLPGERMGYIALNPLGAAFLHEIPAIRTYLAAVRKEFDASPFLNPDRPFQSAGLAAIGASSTLAGYLDSLTDDALLKSVLSVHCLLHGVSPQEVAFAHHARVVGSYLQSVHGVAGGGLSLVRAFERALRAASVELRCGYGARRILLDSAGTVRAVETSDGGVIEAQGVLCTAHPKFLPELAPEGFRPAYRRRIRALMDTPSAYMLFGLSEPVGALEGRNLFICPETDVAAFFRPGRTPEQGPFYAVSGAEAGNGRRTVTVIAPGYMDDVAQWADSRPGKRPGEYGRHKRVRLKAMAGAVLRHAPELAGVSFVDGATPLTLRDFMHAPAGSLYGAGHTAGQFNPAPVTRIPGLWAAGQGVVAPGVLGAVVSAFLACGCVIGHDILREEVRACR